MNSGKAADLLADLHALDDLLDASDEDMDAEVLREAEEMKAVCAVLEEAFPETGLRFTSAFRGIMPVQAYGWILGQRFYFRFRGDTATLVVGNVDPVKAEAEFERKVALHARGDAQRAYWTLSGQKDVPLPADAPVDEHFRKSVIDRLNLVVETDFSVDAYPNDVSQRVSIPELTGHKWNGMLTPAGAIDAFTRLVEKLDK